MNIDPPRLKKLQPYEPYPGDASEEPWLQSGRVKLFAITFGAVLLIGLAWTLLQPVVYRSSATVLMSAPAAIDAQIAEANVQNVAIQRRILLGDEITGRVLDSAREMYSEDLDTAYLTEVLQVVPVTDTNLVEMAAQGSDEELLPGLVNTWIDVYIDARAADIEQSKQHSMQLVEDELGEMGVKIELARDALDTYRQEHDIISAQREENEVLSRLDGLNKALNTAIEEEVKTRVYMDTVRESLSKGKAFIPPSEMANLRGLETELQELRGQMAEMTKRYTMEYIAKQPQLRAVPERIAELESEFASLLEEGQQVELVTAQQAHSAASRAVTELQRKLDEHKQAVSEFNRIYATHQALVDDLAGLEELNRESQARLVQMEVRRVEKYPQVTIIERPGNSERIGPDYLLLLGSTLAAAFVAGIGSVWLYGFLGPKKTQPAYVTLSGVHLYPQEVSGELAYSSQPDPRLASSQTRLLREDDAGEGEGASEDAGAGEKGHLPE